MEAPALSVPCPLQRFLTTSNRFYDFINNTFIFIIIIILPILIYVLKTGSVHRHSNE